MQRQAFSNLLNELMQPQRIKDYCPNGLQIQGADQVRRIVTGVTASQALIDAAVAAKADTIIVHHGYFWKNEPYPITGIKHKRISTLINHNMNLFAYHLPLDIHPTLGNNAQLAQRLEMVDIEPLETNNELSVSMKGAFATPLSADQLSARINASLQRTCLHIPTPSQKPIQTVAWCTGGGQGYIELAAEQGIDAFISGEISEQTTHIAREMDIHYFAAGHHASERYGVKALGDYLQKHHQFDVRFIDIDNPA